MNETISQVFQFTKKILYYIDGQGLLQVRLGFGQA